MQDQMLNEYQDSREIGNDENSAESDTNPGATTMWFGKHEGVRLNELDEGYRRILVHLSYEKPSPNLVRFRALHETYLDWLDGRQSPLSTIIWFGKYKGHEMRIIYTRPGRWRWLLANCDKWRRDLVDIEQRYWKWKKLHPIHYHSRPTPREIVNRVGERLGPRDDEVASDNDDSYDSDDGFVVRTDEEDESDDGTNLDNDEDDHLECESEQGSNEIMKADEDVDEVHYVARDPRHDDSDSSECSLPRLSNVLLKTPEKAKVSPTRSRLFRRSEANCRTQGSSTQGNIGSDSDAPISYSSYPRRGVTTDAVLGRGTASFSTTTPKRRRRTIIDSDSDDVLAESPTKKRSRPTDVAQHESR